MSSTTITPHIAVPTETASLEISRARWRFPLHACVILFFLVTFFFAHEFGHALVAQFFGARVVMFNVLGTQWYPKLEWMPELGFGGYVYKTLC